MLTNNLFVAVGLLSDMSNGDDAKLKIFVINNKVASNLLASFSSSLSN